MDTSPAFAPPRSRASNVELGATPSSLTAASNALQQGPLHWWQAPSAAGKLLLLAAHDAA
eukprot:CAMPEP_0172938258 /NCGR_PEP_ID=MMETSP1075-20121228/222934_1 /TAXON_ID=2916 /ORGANISM="Ceratium fusus, Strain PA161109" /LENGTH=59 /DNA_ID=CAMNT_0013799637 /DNA_START=241 /DNA_END=420 /DNA_ORIENTATION=+